MKKVLIFDFDGTIADTEAEFIRIFNHLAEKHHFLLITKENKEILRKLAPLAFFKAAKVPLWKVPILMLEGRGELEKTIAVVKPIKGIKEQLRVLREKGVSLHILTSNSKQNVTKFLEKHEMPFFDSITSAKNIFGKDKPLLALIDKNKFAKEEVFYVGDEVRDIEATKRAGVKMIAVTWGFGPKGTLAAYNPDFLIDKPEQLLSIA